MRLCFRYAARSDVGLVREGNEDSGLASSRLLVVADGMGGHAAGEVASRLAVQALADLPTEHRDDDPLRRLAGAVAEGNRRIRTAVREAPGREGMGTTLTALAPTADGRLAVAHVGDSRAYLLRDGRLHQLTHDQTYVQALVDEGRITPAEADVHPARSLILRALGQPGDVEPDLDLVEMRLGDRLLLCSDGLSGVVPGDSLAAALGAGSVDELGSVAASLVDLALRAGAPDNVTVIAAEVVEDPSPEPDADGTGGPPATTVATAPVVVGAAEEPAGVDPAGPVRSRGRRAVRAAPAAGDAESGADPEELRYAPRPPRRLSRVRLLGVAVAVLGVLGLAGWGAWTWSQRQYFVGADNGSVAIFRGLPQEIAGTRISTLDSVADGLPVAALPEFYREEVDAAISADDVTQAHAIVDRLRRAACSAVTAGTRPTPAPAPTPAPTTGPTPAASAAPSPPVPAVATQATAAPAAAAPAAATTTPTARPAPMPAGLVCPAANGTTP